MLVVARRENEWIRIEPADGLDPTLTLRDAFAHGPIVVTVVQTGRRVRLVIDAPPALKIWRGPRAAPLSAQGTSAVAAGLHAPASAAAPLPQGSPP